MNHSLRFGIITIQDGSWPSLIEHWKPIESLGADSVWVGRFGFVSHFLNLFNQMKGDRFPLHPGFEIP